MIAFCFVLLYLYKASTDILASINIYTSLFSHIFSCSNVAVIQLLINKQHQKIIVFFFLFSLFFQSLFSDFFFNYVLILTCFLLFNSSFGYSSRRPFDPLQGCFTTFLNNADRCKTCKCSSRFLVASTQNNWVNLMK